MIDVYEKDCVEQIYVLYKEGGKLLQEAGRLKKIEEFYINLRRCSTFI